MNYQTIINHLIIIKMKKLLYSLMAISVMAFGFAACENEGGEEGEKGAKVSESDILGNWISDSIVVNVDAPRQQMQQGELEFKHAMIVTVSKERMVFMNGDTLGSYKLEKGVLTIDAYKYVYDEASHQSIKEPYELKVVVKSFSKEKAVIVVKDVEQYAWDNEKDEEVTFTADETIYFSRLPEAKGSALTVNKANIVGAWQQVYNKYTYIVDGVVSSNGLYPASEAKILELKADGTLTETYFRMWEPDSKPNVVEGIWTLKGNKLVTYVGNQITSVDQLELLPEDYLLDLAQTVSQLTSDFMALNRRYESSYQGVTEISDITEYYTKIQ